MNLEWTEEQKLLRESAARFCKMEFPVSKVRTLVEQPLGVTDELWSKIAEQAWLGVLVPEAYGGLGLGVTELGIILEEFGRALVPGPFFSTAALGVPAIALGGSEQIKKGWLERIASGEARATLALQEEDGQLGPEHVQLRATKQGSGFLLEGRKFFVPDAAAAEVFVVSARTGTGADGTTLFLVEKGQKGIVIKDNKLSDSTSRSGQLQLNGVEVPEDCVIGKPNQGWETVSRVLQIANVGIAAQAVGGAEQVLQQAVGYARERKQFGVPIGSFQAVKHPLANLFAEIESARSAYHYAAWAVDAESEDRTSAVAVARLTATDAFTHATLVSLQAHGGIGFTWEYDLHLYLKRAKHFEYFLGIASDYESIVARDALKI